MINVAGKWKELVLGIHHLGRNYNGKRKRENLPKLKRMFRSKWKIKNEPVIKRIFFCVRRIYFNLLFFKYWNMLICWPLRYRKWDMKIVGSVKECTKHIVYYIVFEENCHFIVFILFVVPGEEVYFRADFIPHLRLLYHTGSIVRTSLETSAKRLK